MKKTLITSLLAMNLILAGCQSAAPSQTMVPNWTQAQTDPQTKAQGETSTGTKPAATATAASSRKKLTFGNYSELITFDMAAALKLWEKEYPGALITSIEFDHDDATWHYEIDGIETKDEMTLTINALTGKVLDRAEENDDEDDEALDFVSIIALDDALEEAQAEASGDTGIEEWKLDWDNDEVWYSFDLEAAEDDLKVNATDRTVITD